MEYTNCLYTTQGEYVCQRNKALDAFYNKPIVEHFDYTEAQVKEAEKIAKTLKACAVKPGDCSEIATTAYHNMCQINPKTKCLYNPSKLPSSMRKAFPQCNASLRAQIDNATVKILQNKIYDPTQLFTCP